jgi:hypothetical protein
MSGYGTAINSQSTGIFVREVWKRHRTIGGFFPSPSAGRRMLDNYRHMEAQRVAIEGGLKDKSNWCGLDSLMKNEDITGINFSNRAAAEKALNSLFDKYKTGVFSGFTLALEPFNPKVADGVTEKDKAEIKYLLCLKRKGEARENFRVLAAEGDDIVERANCAVGYANFKHLLDQRVAFTPRFYEQLGHTYLHWLFMKRDLTGVKFTGDGKQAEAEMNRASLAYNLSQGLEGTGLIPHIKVVKLSSAEQKRLGARYILDLGREMLTGLDTLETLVKEYKIVGDAMLRPRVDEVYFMFSEKADPRQAVMALSSEFPGVAGYIMATGKKTAVRQRNLRSFAEQSVGFSAMLKERLNQEPFRTLFGEHNLARIKFTGDGKEAERAMDRIISSCEGSGEWDGVAMDWTSVKVERIPERYREELNGLKYLVGVDGGFASIGPFE